MQTMMDREKSQSATNSQSSSATRDNAITPSPDHNKEHKKNEDRRSSAQYDVPDPMQRILCYEDRRSTFYKSLEEALALDYIRIRNDVENNRIPEHLPPYPVKEGETVTVDEKTAYYCNLLKSECYDFIEPLHDRLGHSISAAIESHTAFENLNKLNNLMDKFCDIIDQSYRMQLYMQDLKNFADLTDIEKMDLQELDDLEFSDPESDFETSLTFLTSILESPNSISTKREKAKVGFRERSKSVFVEGAHQPSDKDPKPPPTRRQSAFTEGKAKVSKWTKVKAAFKWEKANVPALNEGKSSDSGIGLIPVNHEVARYLRVPSIPCGGSSADSILSSSSGHLLSEAGTPGTISSASSVDDIERASQSTRRDSSKSDSKCDSRITIQAESHRSHSIDGDLGSHIARQEPKDASPLRKHKRDPSESSDHKNSPNTSQSSLDRITDAVKKPTKSASLKGIRKSKVMSDFEVLPEDVTLDITSTAKRVKHLPSPLNLNLKHDLSESDYADYSQSPCTSAKSPWDKTKNRKFQSPGNSSVPSSPSRHSEFFPEFESEDLSSGDFSEPTTPHSKLFSGNNLHMQQEEIHQRYRALRDRLKMEFDAKRQEWEKYRNQNNYTKSTAYNLVSKDDPPQQQAQAMSTKLLEENLTPDFKKKLHKWRVKKQISLHTTPKELQASPTKESETKKIDWNLWRTGQIKLEGQGLSPLPDQKDLPEEFQRKLEQWNKIKSGRPTHSGHDSLKRLSKHESGKKSHDDEKQRSDKSRFYERDKLEKLSKLKAYVADPRAKEIEVKTTAGVMKFEGISRKFTRKLYEWEKARGIGPEASTFALLHPGYCPLDVGMIPKEGNKNENSPTLSRSLSLDSVAQVVPIPTISHQTSSLSLNDVNELNETESTDAEQRVDSDLKHTDEPDEPEAVMVEVEDHIVETASPLVAVLPMVEHQTPVYRYAEVTCNDFCKTRSVQSFESHHSCDGDQIKTLNYINDLWLQLESRNEFSDENLKYFQTVFSTMRSSFADFESNLNGSGAKRSFGKVRELVDDLYEINNLLQMEEACCQELIDERQMVFRKKLDDLHTILNEVRQHIENEKGSNQSTVPEISVTSDDGLNDHFNVSTTLANTAVAIAAAALSTTLEASDDLSTPATEISEGDALRRTVNRNISNGNTKKKLRLRKMGSRQNSKTESDSSDGEFANVLETPRRVKRRASNRIKQRSFEEDRKSTEESRPADDGNAGEDVVYVLKVKPGKPIEQQEISHDKGGKLLISPRESHVELIHTPQTETVPTSNKANVFVKTKRKVFTTVEEPGSTDGLAVIATELDTADTKTSTAPKSPKARPNNDPAWVRRPNTPNINKPSISPGIKSMISKLCENMPLEKLANSNTSIEQKKPSTPNSLRTDYNPIYKSVSTGDIFANAPFAAPKRPNGSLPAKSQSFVSLKEGWESYQKSPESPIPTKTRIPLANDSFRTLKKTYSPILTKGPSIIEKREHLFRKNKNASPTLKSSGTGRRIETKIAKSATNTEAVGYPLSPDKSDNTIPKITRKLDHKSLTPTNKRSNFEFQEPIPSPSVSEPSTPMHCNAERPRTPISERAIRLQKAKEEFLQAELSPKVILRRDTASGRPKEKWENRHSQQSMGSDVSAGGLTDGILLKSVSVGMLPADSDCSEQQGEGYDSLPRHVSRSGKLTSKLGFATLASKFRKVKLRRGSKEAMQPIKGSALSHLCRQSLFVDLNSVTQQNLMKSASSQAAIGDNGLSAISKSAAAKSSDQLNKSQSDHHFPFRKKESCV